MKLFVYGTLKSNFDNEMAIFLRERASLLCKGTVKGKLFLLGWYPGLMLSQDGYKVQGEVYDVHKDMALVLKTLDEYEGVDTCDYRRVLQSVKTNYGDIVCWLYESLVESDKIIETGIFLEQTKN